MSKYKKSFNCYKGYKGYLIVYETGTVYHLLIPDNSIMEGINHFFSVSLFQLQLLRLFGPKCIQE